MVSGAGAAPPSPDPNATTTTTVVEETLPDDLPRDPREVLFTADGRWDVNAVLAVFATKQPIDGVTPDPAIAALMDDEELAEALLAVMDQLTPEQQALATAFVFPGPPQSVETFVIDEPVAPAVESPPAVDPSGMALFEPSDPAAPDAIGTDANVPSSTPDSAAATSTPQQPQGFASLRPRTIAEDAAGYLRTYFRNSGVAASAYVFEVEHGPTSGTVLASALPLTDGRTGCLSLIHI